MAVPDALTSELLALEADAHLVFNSPASETPQFVRDVIEWYAASIRVALDRANQPTNTTDQVRWCGSCGEGVTFFCRSKTVGECPMKLGRVVANQETKP